tara:strand:- start:352 stop:492 length:141 start_codon:yes stop_codon:yes gene_type:complete
MKFLACALKNKIKIKPLFFGGCYAVATFKQLPKFATPKQWPMINGP